MQLISLTSIITAVAAQQLAWGQCGGNGWTGETSCVNGYTCQISNEWYSQCIPSSAAPGKISLSSHRINYR
ncbi:uncharacterized protein BDR25DRAFT_225149 [Lindgomyces ingoldianus]|uniref:Uncharacterized protein n=1 Tax=Lindgomyces ingoldianus TaxID=673940 RepID=A0ACB6QV18_9PLEO|nr:uncharacterized protein BDR25DRAFT_225149 [Lindgomyces ingoldianus]KAF2470717.1 hypothetical protein BDR25DRAFT_225149 [Lindgomyces ingoldianus]